MVRGSFNVIGFSLCALVFSMIPLVLISANAQQYPSGVPAMPTAVTGKYANSDYGVQMTFPNGWQGFEAKTQNGTTVVATPQSQETGSQGSGPGSTMMLVMAPKPTGTVAPYTPYTPPPNTQVKCNTISSDNTNVNGMSAGVIVMQCSGPGVDMKMKIYSFQTDHNFISAIYTALSSSNYDNNVATFDSAVNTLQIANTIAAPSAPASNSPTSTIPSSTSSATSPEFPTTVGIVMAVITGLVILVTRTRLSFSFGKTS